MSLNDKYSRGYRNRRNGEAFQSLAFVLLQRREARRSTSFLRERGTPIACRAPTRSRERASERAQLTHEIATGALPYGSSPSGVNERVFRADSRRPRRILRGESRTDAPCRKLSLDLDSSDAVSVEITARRDRRTLKASARRLRESSRGVPQDRIGEIDRICFCRGVPRSLSPSRCRLDRRSLLEEAREIGASEDQIRTFQEAIIFLAGSCFADVRIRWSSESRFVQRRAFYPGKK